MRRTILALDLTEDSKYALQWLIENVARADDEIHLCHVAKIKVGVVL